MEIQQGNFHLIEHYVEIILSAENLLQAESGTVQTLLNMKNNIRRMQEDLSLSSDQFEKKVS